ncbi:MAG: hypothetical protein KF878_31000 [Planctomycetes bacterium]|nr:hypothetical protein [Planctomycetota bacterium]
MSTLVFGELVLGRIDEVEEQVVATTFFVVGGPIAPLRCEVIGCSRDAALSWGTFGRSVGLGYYRFWGAVLPSFLFLASINTGRPLTRWLERDGWITYGVLLLLWLLSFFAFGRVGAAERRRRVLLGSRTGINVSPRMLTRASARVTLAHLEEEWRRERPGVEWRDRLDDADPEDALLLYALAAYTDAVERTPGSRAKERAAWRLLAA